MKTMRATQKFDQRFSKIKEEDFNSSFDDIFSSYPSLSRASIDNFDFSERNDALDASSRMQASLYLDDVFVEAEQKKSEKKEIQQKPPDAEPVYGAFEQLFGPDAPAKPLKKLATSTERAQKDKGGSKTVSAALKNLSSQSLVELGRKTWHSPMVKHKVSISKAALFGIDIEKRKVVPMPDDEMSASSHHKKRLIDTLSLSTHRLSKKDHASSTQRTKSSTVGVPSLPTRGKSTGESIAKEKRTEGTAKDCKRSSSASGSKKKRSSSLRSKTHSREVVKPYTDCVDCKVEPSKRLSSKSNRSDKKKSVKSSKVAKQTENSTKKSLNDAYPHKKKPDP